jgi:[ribosomal protein S5]-alanine N-acetyltransferase
MSRLTQSVVPAGSIGESAQPVITGDALLLRAWTDSDVPVLLKAYSDAEIQRWHAQSLTADEAAAWIAVRAERWRQERGADWAVERDGVVVGRVGLRTMDLDEGIGEVAYWVMAGCRGSGIAVRALEALTGWALDSARLHRLELRHATGNTASCRVAAKVDYHLEGTAISSTLHADGWHDMHVHARVSLP